MDESNANISRADSGQEERMRSNHDHHCGSRYMGMCRALGTEALGTMLLGIECAGTDLTVLETSTTSTI